MAVNRLQLLICVLGVYATFLTWGILQERVTTTNYNGEYFKYFIFLNFIQAMAATVLAYFYQRWMDGPIQQLPNDLLKKFVVISILNSLASPFGYASLKFINYPTLILGKSCKLIPVMVMGKILHNKTYPLYKYVSVGLITLGVSGFMMGKKSKGEEVSSGMLGSLFGLFLVLINLTIDGVTNSTQDVMFKQYPVLTGPLLMLYMNFFSSIIMGLYLVVSVPFTGELLSALQFCANHPAVLKDIVLFGMCGGLGQLFIFYTLEKFGSLVLVTVTVTRKMLSILLSVMWFGHHLSNQQWLAVALSFVGIAFEDLIKVLGHFKLVDTYKWGVVSKHHHKKDKPEKDDVESESGESQSIRKKLDRGRNNRRGLMVNGGSIANGMSPSRGANTMEKGQAKVE